MEPEARYTLVGAVVLALIAGACAAWIWLSQGGGGAGFRFYTIHFESQSLEGLQQGSDVTMRGVKVGRVQEYSISRDNINRVDVIIRTDRETPVSSNTNAVVSRNLVTGLARIDLVTPGTPGPELNDVPNGERYPVIPEGKSDLEQIAGALSRLAVTGENVLNNLEHLLAPETRDTLIGAMAAVRDLAGGLDKRLDRIDMVAVSLRDAATAFQTSSKQIAVAISNVSQDAAKVAAQIAPIGHQVNSALADLSSAAKTLERESALVARRLEHSVDAGALELRATARDLRGSAEMVSRAADRLREPSAALLGPTNRQLGPGEVLP
ncbi:MAG: MlaD family protein [Burkholderiaceae bacterium]